MDGKRTNQKPPGDSPAGPPDSDEVFRIRIFGEPVLRRTTRPVEELNDEIFELIHKMLLTMYQAPGVGLAAPQVGESLRLCVIDVGEGSLAFINPEVVAHSEELVSFEEGCLSFPELNADVFRPETVTVKADALLEKGEINKDGPFEQDFDGLLARVLQHEIDHLDGRLFVDRVTPGVRRSLDSALKKFKKQSKQYVKEDRKKK